MTWYRPRLLEYLLSPEGEVSGLPKETDPLFEVSLVDETEIARSTLLPNNLEDYSHQTPFQARITDFQLISGSEAVKMVYSVRLDVSRLFEWDWMPGDSFGVLPENDTAMVSLVLNRLGFDGQVLIRLNPIGKITRESLIEFWAERESKTTKIWDLFQKHLDLSYFPKKACLLQLAACCSCPKERDVLLFLASKSGSALYLKAAGERTTIVDFLFTFPSCKPSLELLLRHLPLLHPRFYSISNSPLDGTGQIEFVFNTIEYRTPEGYERKGICSSWLERATPGCCIPLVPRKDSGKFRPCDPSIPTLLICSGTGVSPFVGFLRHFGLSGVKTASWLFYGFRNVDSDFLFKDELQALSKDVLQQLSIAVSKQPKLGYPKYVQDAIRAEQDTVWGYLQSHPQSRIYLCGDELTMVKDVTETLASLFAEKLGVSLKEASDILVVWTKEHRFIKDIWI